MVIGGLRPASEVWFFGRVDAEVFAAWGQVIGAAGTLLAVTVAIWIAIRDGRYRDAERRDNEAVHARLISGFRVSDPPRLSIGYVNYGDSLVSSVRITDIVGRFGDTHSVGWFINGSSEPYTVGAIGPGQTAKIPPISIIWPDGAEVDETAALYYPTIVFIDANGRWWKRTAHDQPVRLLEPPAPVSRLPRKHTGNDDISPRLH